MSGDGRVEVTALPPFEQIVRDHTDAAWRFAVSMLRDPHDAEEAVQDTFTRVHGGLAGFRGDASLRTWILAICRRVCIDRIRRRRLETVELDPAVPDPRTGPAEEAALRTLLGQALQELDDDEREAVVLVDVLGMSAAEAARVCDTPATTMRSRLYRAHDQLVAAIEQGASA